MDQNVQAALGRGGTIDITTIGRRTGEPRRIEIVFHALDGRIYISGMARADRKRAWIYNLEADPKFTFHLKGATAADLPAHARVITDETERREVIRKIIDTSWHTADFETMVRHSPLIEVTFDSIAA